jgi:hypothetical protein
MILFKFLECKFRVPTEVLRKSLVQAPKAAIFSLQFLQVISDNHNDLKTAITVKWAFIRIPSFLPQSKLVLFIYVVPFLCLSAHRREERKVS